MIIITYIFIFTAIITTSLAVFLTFKMIIDDIRSNANPNKWKVDFGPNGELPITTEKDLK